MLETKEQKQIFAGSIALIIILAVISFSSRPNLDFTKQPQNNLKTGNEILNSQAYLDYLRSVKVDPKASQQLFETVLTKEQIRDEVEKKLDTAQQITAPPINFKKINIAANSDAAVNSYLSQSIGEAYKFNETNRHLLLEVFAGNPESARQLGQNLSDLNSRFFALSVPKDALDLHKNLMTAYAAYADMVAAAKDFDPSYGTKNDKLWPSMYRSYVLANQSTLAYQASLNSLAAKYKVSQVQIYYPPNDPKAASLIKNFFVPEAKAFLGLNFSFTIGDIPRIIMDTVKEGLRNAFLQFIGNMLDNLIVKIEQNYVIANFLYYSDALVNGEYVDDYLNKYVSDPLDRGLIKNFIPQFSCGKNADLKPVFLAQANKHLGFDPSALDLNDPNYYQKMASVGDFLSSPQGWKFYYQDLASQAESAAQQSIDRELSSSGLKTPRNAVDSSIASSINNIISAERAGFEALLQLGVDNADSLIAETVAALTQQLVNKFVFQGVSANKSGSIVVLKEQPTCMQTALINPILPMPSTQFQQPGPAPTAQAAIASQCSLLTSISDDCTSAILNELSICANNPSQHSGSQTCSSLANSAYVNAFLGFCQKQLRPGPDCATIQTLLQKVP